MHRRLGASDAVILSVQGNLASIYQMRGRDEALPMRRTVYFGTLKLFGEEHITTLREATSYAVFLKRLKYFEEAKLLLRKKLPVARRAVGESDSITLTMRWVYAEALYKDADATRDDLRESVTTLEETERAARRVFGGAHPTSVAIESHLRDSRAALRARETSRSL